MKTIGIKLADGSFYPVLQEGSTEEVVLNLTTANNNQTKIMVDLYRSRTASMEDAEYVDSLQIENLNEHPNGEPDISFTVSLDENNELHAKIMDPETGAQSNSTITLVSRTIEERLITDDYKVEETNNKTEDFVIPDDATKAENNFSEDALAAFGGEAATQTDSTEDLDNFFDNISEEAEPEIEEESVEIPEYRPEQEEPVPEEEPSVEQEPSAEEETQEVEAEPFIPADLPDFPEESSAESEPLPDFTEETQTTEAETTESETDPFISTDLPDMDFPMDTPAESETTQDIPAETDPFAATDLPDFPEEQTAGDFSTDDIPNSEDFGDFDLPDMPETETSDDNLNFEDDISPASGGISFTGLYDKETEFGDSSSYDPSKKTKKPVIICVVCAIICLIAVALVLFVLPTEYNLIKNGTIKIKPKTEKVAKTTDPVAEEPVVETPVVESIPAAKEDEIVIIEKAEEVVPLPPPAKEEKPQDIIYKIKWGDTLWDISDTYYKNPWRYTYIARFNGIPNPDYIVSGTYITIPAE